MTADAMEAEFDTVAVWTEQVVADLGSEYAIPAACRGSGDPSWLAWLADALGVQSGERFLDDGAGLGGPAAWLREHRGAVPVLAEPMLGAAAGALRLFGMPTVAAWSQALPFADDSFDVGWLLGVLCTTTDKRDLLNELHRVLTPGGRLGLLVLVQVVDELVDPPEGNDFPTPDSLAADLRAAGFEVTGQVKTSELPEPEEQWQQRVQRVEDTLNARYEGNAAWSEAEKQGEKIGRILRDGDIETWLISARSRPLG
jgi:ubiquinone/menaquinone biosynthesis C-methylase UbiE